MLFVLLGSRCRATRLLKCSYKVILPFCPSHAGQLHVMIMIAQANGQVDSSQGAEHCPVHADQYQAYSWMQPFGPFQPFCAPVLHFLAAPMPRALSTPAFPPSTVPACVSAAEALLAIPFLCMQGNTQAIACCGRSPSRSCTSTRSCASSQSAVHVSSASRSPARSGSSSRSPSAIAALHGPAPTLAAAVGAADRTVYAFIAHVWTSHARLRGPALAAGAPAGVGHPAASPASGMTRDLNTAEASVQNVRVTAFIRLLQRLA